LTLLKTSLNNNPRLDDFHTDSYSKIDVLFHSAGVLLNASCTIAALVWLFANWRQHLPAWHFFLLATVVGIFVGDFITGLLHWAFDTWFSEKTSVLSRMVIMVREHHVYPDRLFQYSFHHHAGPLSWMAFFFTAPVFFLAIYVPSALSQYAVWTGILVSFEIVFMFEFHKFGHRMHPFKVTRGLQRLRLLLSPEHHLRHHSGNHDRNYCLINGVADDVCGNAFVWRGLERIISSLTGAVPQSSDHDYLRRRERQP
jgi:ubiquitin-conjugating enzyme E2 variant